jgi:hypothetical protein
MESIGGAVRNDTDERAGEGHPNRRPGLREEAARATGRGAGDTAAPGDTRRPPRLTEYLLEEAARANGRGAGDTAAPGDTRRPPRLTKYLTRPFQSWDKRISAELKNLHGQRIPEYDAAISSCSVTLQQIVDVRYRLHKDSCSDEESSLIDYEKLLWQAYQRARGKIKEYYFSTEARIGAVLIKPHRRRKAMDLDFFYPIDRLGELTPEFESTLWTCISQFQSMAELDLKFKGQAAVFLELYLIVIYIFVAAEAQQTSHPPWYEYVPRFAQRISKLTRRMVSRTPPRGSPDARSVRTPDVSPAPRRVMVKAVEDITGYRIKEALANANAYLRTLTTHIAQYSKQEAQVVYIRALFPGFAFVLALVAAYCSIIYEIGVTRHWTSDAQLSWHLFAIAATTGALGAVVSVMLRVANKPLTINYSAGRGLIRLAGVFRPVVGAIFGLVFFVLINAGLLQVLAAPHKMGSRAFFVAAICFAAGFSERRAQDVIVRALPVEKETEPVADQSPARRPNGGTAS